MAAASACKFVVAMQDWRDPPSLRKNRNREQKHENTWNAFECVIVVGTLLKITSNPVD